MASTGFLPLQTCADESSVGTEPWTLSGAAPLVGTEVSLNDNVYAGCQESSGLTSHFLKCTNALDVTSAIPLGATIDGAEVRFRRHRHATESAFAVTAMVAKFVRAGTIAGNDIGNSDDWPTTEAAQTLGGAAELGGLTWTRGQATDAGSGIALSITFAEGVTTSLDVTHLVDLVEINWHYTEGAAPTRIGVLPLTGAG